MSASIRIGTSGWSYPEGAGSWSGLFYPPRGARGFRAADELRYYAERFDTVEVNSTFYRTPSSSTTRRWAEQTPAGFEFSIKLLQRFTHAGMIGRGHGLPKPGRDADRKVLPSPTPSDVEEFRAALDPLVSAGKMGALLVQFPAGFRSTPETRDYLADLLLDFREYPLAVELRHKSWSDDAGGGTTSLLDGVGAAWVQIDEPKFRFSIRQDFSANTAGCYYLRLHGRNAAQWWKHDSPDDRYNYLYTPAELQPFANAVQEAAGSVRKAYLYLNNHFAAKSIVNATVLKHQLGMPIEGEYREELVERYPELKGVVKVGGSLI